jgi:hypothetical protein
VLLLLLLLRGRRLLDPRGWWGVADGVSLLLLLRCAGRSRCHARSACACACAALCAEVRTLGLGGRHARRPRLLLMPLLRLLRLLLRAVCWWRRLRLRLCRRRRRGGRRWGKSALRRRRGRRRLLRRLLRCVARIRGRDGRGRGGRCTGGRVLGHLVRKGDPLWGWGVQVEEQWWQAFRCHQRLQQTETYIAITRPPVVS